MYEHVQWCDGTHAPGQDDCRVEVAWTDSTDTPCSVEVWAIPCDNAYAQIHVDALYKPEDIDALRAALGRLLPYLRTAVAAAQCEGHHHRPD